MMSLSSFRHTAPLFVGLVLSLATACATGPMVETMVYESPDGVVVVETVELRATVTAIDATTRKITLDPEYGETTVVKADEAVVNFNQIRVGDEVDLVVVDQLAVSLIEGGTEMSAGAMTAVELAPIGAKPGAMVVKTVEVTGTIIAVDTHEHSVTLALPDGTAKEIKVGKHRDLSQVGLGDSVRLTLTEAVAISVQTPQS